jgi:ribosomal protein S12 methylthiotransferase accessory factor
MEIEVYFEGKKQVNARVGRHIIKTDQPMMAGGEDVAPTPYETFLASMATCAGIYVKGFCDNRNIPTDGITLTQSHSFDEKGFAAGIDIMINLPEGFPEKYVDSLIHVANLCKVKQQMSNPPQMNVKAKIGK